MESRGRGTLPGGWSAELEGYPVGSMGKNKSLVVGRLQL